MLEEVDKQIDQNKKGANNKDVRFFTLATRVDAKTKRDFRKVCSHRGVSSCKIMEILVKGFIKSEQMKEVKNDNTEA